MRHAVRAALVGAILVAAHPAAAMCGGNIFATCPPSGNGSSAAAQAKREKRLKAVQAKKRHYPLLKR